MGRVSQCPRPCPVLWKNTGVSCGVVSSHIEVSTCSAMVCRPLFSSSIWHLFAMFLNNRGYRVSLCSGATSRSRSWSLRHSSFLSHHWGKQRESRWEEDPTGSEIWNQNTMSCLISTYREGYKWEEGPRSSLRPGHRWHVCDPACPLRG